MEKESEIQKEEIIILPEVKSLTAEELIKYRNVEINEVKSGLRKPISDGSLEEKNELKRLQDELREQLHCPRIETVSGRSIAEWDPECKRIKVLKKIGKFQNFGYSENQILYLDNFEALFLLELNRLELYFKSTLISIEQAYYLLLGEHKNKNYENYLVYSTLSRAGYIVKRHENLTNYTPIEIPETEIIWEILLSSIKPNYEVPLYIENHENYELLKNSMNLIKQKIICSQNIENNNNNAGEGTSKEENISFAKKLTKKRKATDENKAYEYKRIRLDTIIHNQQNHKSFLDDLLNEPTHSSFGKIFKKLSILQAKSDPISDGNVKGIKDFNIVFDLYLPTNNSLKTNPPNLRVIVLESTECFPNRAELNKVYNQQFYKAPLIFVSVGVSKQLQAFMYYFTQN